MDDRKPATVTCEQELAAIIDSLDVLGGKWKLRIIRHLANHAAETNTFRKILREVEGISSKMLAKELHDLEMNLLVTKKEVADRLRSVNYVLTPYGLSVLPINDVLVQWGLRHRQKIQEG